MTLLKPIEKISEMRREQIWNRSRRLKQLKKTTETGPESVEVVLTWKAAKTDIQLMSFLAFANNSREFFEVYEEKIYAMQ